MISSEKLFAEIDKFFTGQSSFDDCPVIVMDFHRTI